MKISESSKPDGAAAGTPCVGRRSFLKGTVIVAAFYLVAASPAPAQSIGPSTTVDPYVLPSMAGVTTTSILTVGDLPAGNGYRMVGIPDGLGAFRRGRDFTVLMNHELGGSAGVVRDHGSKGSFVSRWTIDRNTLAVVKGEDMTQSPADVRTWDPTLQQYVAGTTVWDRLCSADLPKEGAYRYRNLGTRDRIFLNGEEVDEGRAWARVGARRHRTERGRGLATAPLREAFV